MTGIESPSTEYAQRQPMRDKIHGYLDTQPQGANFDNIVHGIAADFDVDPMAYETDERRALVGRISLGLADLTNTEATVVALAPLKRAGPNAEVLVRFRTV